jgi:hypothetical protein
MTSLTDLREVVDVVIGVDTHVHTHCAAVIDSATGGVLGEITVAARAAGYAELVEFANNYPMLRAWAIEGTGGHGAGLSLTCWAHRSSSSSWTVRSGPRDATARSPIPLMRSEPRVRRWRDRGWEHRAAGANAKPCQCF